MGYTVTAIGDPVSSGKHETTATSAREALRMFRATRRMFGEAIVHDETGRAVEVNELNRLAEHEQSVARRRGE